MPAAENAASESFELRVYIEVLRRRWRVIAAVALTALLLALALTLPQDKQYKAEADVLLKPTSNAEALVGDSASIAYTQALNVARQLTNAVESFESGDTRDAVAKAYSGTLDPDDVNVAIKDPNTSDVVIVSLTAKDPAEAAKLVNLYVETFITLQREQRINDIGDASDLLQQKLDDLDARIATIRQPLTDVEAQLLASPGNAALAARRDDLAQTLAVPLTPLVNRQSVYQQTLEDLRLQSGVIDSGGARFLTRATTPTDAVAPKPGLTGAIALIVGLMLGVVLAFLRDNLDERLRGLDDLERAAPGRALLAAVPELRTQVPDSFVAVRDDARGVMAEAFRSLRTSVKFAGLDTPLRVIQVTSAFPGEGKTTAVANLATAMSTGGERVVVVCCDLRRPRIHKRFSQPQSPGFTDVLLRDVNLGDALRRVNDNLYLLAAGSPPPNPSELLSSNRAVAVIEALVAEFDVVIIDSTPVLPVTDALVVSRMVDATLVVVDTRTTKRKVLRQAIERLEQVSAPITGLVLNGVGANDSYLYGYGYGYSYEAEGAPGDTREPVAADARGS